MGNRFYEQIVTACAEQTVAGQVGGVLRVCSDVPSQPSLWVTLAPMFALAAAIYAAMASIGEYLELKDKNFKELLASGKMASVSSAQIYGRARLRIGQRWQWSAKFGGALVALVILTTYFITESGAFDPTALAACALTVVALACFNLFRFRAKKVAVMDAGLFTPAARQSAQPDPEYMI